MMLGPSQSDDLYPPSHVLARCWRPPPHGREHSVQSDHSDQPPSEIPGSTSQTRLISQVRVERCETVENMLTSPNASAVTVAHAFLMFHGTDFEQVHIDRGLAREAEAAFDAAEIGVVGQEPGCPRCNAFRFGAGVRVAHLVFRAATRAVGSSVLRRRAVAASLPRPDASAARRRALAPVVPVGPLTVDGRGALDRARRVARAVDLVAVDADAEAAAESRLGIAASTASGLHGRAARLRTRRPRGPLGPAAVPRAVRHLVTVTQAALAAVSRCRPVALALPAHAPVALGAVAGVCALGPLAPISPPAVH